MNQEHGHPNQQSKNLTNTKEPTKEKITSQQKETSSVI
jgi:hypothetical protein